MKPAWLARSRYPARSHLRPDSANGTIGNPRFSAHRVPRFADVPPIEVVLLDRTDLPLVGAGETPIVAIAPAIANAIRHATGIRLRAIPMMLSNEA